MAALDISPIKIGYVIIKARECAAKVAAWDDGATTDHDADSILESFSDDATRSALKGYIQDMNEDEQAASSRLPGSAGARLRRTSSRRR